MPDFIFNGWGAILRMLVIAPAAYVAVVLILRMSGKRTLSKLNAFDFIVTIAIGSTLASVITTRSLALAEGVVALAILVGLQFVVTAASVRWPSLGRALKAEPTLLLCNGEPLFAAMKRQRITLQELDVAVRQAGGVSRGQAQAIYLEADGTLTDGCRGHGGVEARQGLSGGPVLVQGDDQPCGGFDAHDRREGCQRDQRQIGGGRGRDDQTLCARRVR